MRNEEIQTLVGAVLATILVVGGFMMYATHRKEIRAWVFEQLEDSDSMICRPDCKKSR
jgi:hypothetical protein